MKEEKESNYESDEYYDGMMESDQPDYYYCSCCHHTQAEEGMGRSCNHCGMFNVMEGEYF